MFDRRKIVPLVGIAALAAAAAALVLAPTRTPPSYSPRLTSEVLAQPRQQPVVLVIGDGYASGEGGVPVRQTFPWRACATLQWVCNVDAQPGTGYVADGGRTGAGLSSYDRRVATNRTRFLADTVVVTGGRSDSGIAGNPQLAATRLFRDLRQAYPQARLVVVEPFWIDDAPPAGIARVRTAVRTAADAAGAHWIDSDDWLNAGLVGDDGIHPNQAGHDVLGKKLAGALRQLDRTDPPATPSATGASAGATGVEDDASPEA